ncbi:YgaP family membrane protein [Neobacillus sp. K501]
MQITKNIGIINALIRITFGLTILAWSTAKMVKFPWRDSYLFVALCGAMKVAEGIVRFCPVTALFENYQNGMQIQQTSTSSDVAETVPNIDVDQVLPYNPS